MKTRFSYIISTSALSLFYSDGTEQLIEKSDRNYHAIINFLMEKIASKNEEVSQSEETLLKELGEPNKFVEEASNGLMRLEKGLPQIKDAAGKWVNIDHEVHERFMHFVDKGTPLEPFIKFYSQLNANPSWNSRGQLFLFIDNKTMPILPTGEVIGYKGVREDFMDIYSGKVHNYIGATIKMERRSVDDNPDNCCSYGYHIGSHRYANSWRGDEGKLLLVAFSPADAVSVPHNASDKLRVCKYRVLADITNRPHELTEAAYTASGESVSELKPYVNEDEDWDYAQSDLTGFKFIQAKSWLYRKLNQGKEPKATKFKAKFDLDEDDFESLLSVGDILVNEEGRIAVLS